MIKAVIFDFDGVILESAGIKTNAFRKLFEDKYPQKAEDIVNYHIKNMGISRYVKFKYIYNKILKIGLNKKQEKLLGKKFSEIVFDSIINTPFVPGALEFLMKNYKEFDLFIASGTPLPELLKIVRKRKLSRYFKEIHGSPEKKGEIISRLSHRYGYVASEMVFIGDSENDRLAALENKIGFIARIYDDNFPLLRVCDYKIKNLINLCKVLNKISANS